MDGAPNGILKVENRANKGHPINFRKYLNQEVDQRKSTELPKKMRSTYVLMLFQK